MCYSHKHETMMEYTTIKRYLKYITLAYVSKHKNNNNQKETRNEIIDLS